MQQLQDKQEIIGNITEQWEQLSNNLGDTNNIAYKNRSRAFERFKSIGLPGSKNETYKYTPITKTLEKNFSFKELSTLPPSTFNLDKHLISGLAGNVLVFINGKFSEENSNIISPKDQLMIGTQIIDLDDSLNDIDKITDPFTLLSTALATTGAVIVIPKGKVLEQPVILYYISDSTAGTFTQHFRNQILIGENSQASIVEYYVGEGEHASFSNSNTEIMVKESAVVDYYKIENENSQAVHVDNTSVQQLKKSVFTAITITLNGRLIRNNLSISINDEYCEANMFGLYLLNGKQHVDNQTVVDHTKPNCLSNELYKGVLDGNSTGVFNGKIYVRPDAQKTNAFQSNKNILLSDDATINTKPQLEIWADDVKCSHGATTGQLDEEQLFYLRSRGLAKDTARAMLLYAFAIDVLDKIKLPALKEFLDKIISGRLQNH